MDTSKNEVQETNGNTKIRVSQKSVDPVKPDRYRNWMCTDNRVVSDDTGHKALLEKFKRWQNEGKITKFGGQYEIAPSTGQKHWQGFVYFKNPWPLKSLVANFPGPHWGDAKGQPIRDKRAVEKYCSKSETRAESSEPKFSDEEIEKKIRDTVCKALHLYWGKLTSEYKSGWEKPEHEICVFCGTRDDGGWSVCYTEEGVWACERCDEAGHMYAYGYRNPDKIIRRKE